MVVLIDCGFDIYIYLKKKVNVCARAREAKTVPLF